MYMGERRPVQVFVQHLNKSKTMLDTRAACFGHLANEAVSSSALYQMITTGVHV